MKMWSQTSKPVSLFLAITGIGSAAVLPDKTPPFSVKVPENTAQGASANIDTSFCGFAFEQSSFTRYAQTDDGKPNVFSQNLIQAITSRTGGHPIIRLGGTSPDYGKYLPGQKAPALPVAEQDNYQDVGHTTIGPSYWGFTRHFPTAKYMVQVPMATKNLSETIAWTQAAVHGIGIENIHSIQPGNEPNLYSDTYRGEGGIELHPPEYQGTLTNQTYVAEYQKYTAAILEAVKELPKGRFFTAFDVATHYGRNVPPGPLLDVERCFALGIDSSRIIKEVSHHYYQGSAGGASDLARGLMDMAATHRYVDDLAARSIAWLSRSRPGLPFVLNEVGNSLQPRNSYAYQNRLGSALWQADFYLHCMARGVARVNYQQIMHAGYNLWLPVASAGHAAQVFANFYSQPFVADFIGGSGKTRVARLDIGGSGGDDENVKGPANVAAYAAYDDDVVRRIAVANLNYWNKTNADAGDRPSVVLDINVPAGVKTVEVAHLNSPLGAGGGADTITYGGSQWTFESLGKEVKGVRKDTENLVVKDGVVRVTVKSSEAVLLRLSTDKVKCKP